MNRLPLLQTLLIASLIAAVAGCGGGSSPPQDDPRVAEEAALRKIASAAELEATIKAGFTTLRPLTPAPTDLSTVTGFTGTYTLEANVDEADAVRYDGTHLWVAPQRSFACCYLLAGGTVDNGTSPPDQERSIRILATDPDNASAELTGSIALANDLSVQGMYLDGDRMVALTSRALAGTYGDFWASLQVWFPEVYGLQFYDVSDRANPTLDFEMEMDGIFVDSRRIGNVVYVVSRYTPQIAGLNYAASSDAQIALNQDVLQNVSLDQLVPKVRIGALERNLIEPTKCYVTNDGSEPAYPVITSITTIPVDDPENFSTTCYTEPAYGIYMSEAALYFAQPLTSATVVAGNTRVHKFALAGTDVRYRGSGDVGGELWLSGQNDFRMNEHAGDLRVVTSSFNQSMSDFVDHNLYVLRESATQVALDVIAQLPNDNRPEEIGKPNERLFGVRFVDDRAYAVTFELIDPLYVIDLSTPADPFVAGAVEVMGFSRFLHSVSDDLLLGLGDGEAGGIKLELFDVSNIAQPLSRGEVTLGARGTYSEATHNRHAFTYQTGSGDLDRFTVPAEVIDESGAYLALDSGLQLFEIRDKSLPNLATLERVGNLPAGRGQDDQIWAWPQRNRAFLHDDTVYYVNDEDVWAASWLAPSQVNGPF